MNDASTATGDGRFDVGTSAGDIRRAILAHLRYSMARDPRTASKREWWSATCLAVRDRILDRFTATMHAHYETDARRAYYLSLEYMMGRLLANNLHNSGLFEATSTALEALGLELEDVLGEEVDMGLGNGGLGRLAACFLDSLATLDLPAIGYGIRYEFGLFKQEFVDGKQVEHPDNWVRFGNPWPMMRPEYTVEVSAYGRVETKFTDYGTWRPSWVDRRTFIGVPWDIPICGHGARTVNFLRLWESRASEDLDLTVFNAGGYVEAVRERAISETVSKVLYPNDQTESGKELRLLQQYFFVCCSLQDIIRRYLSSHDDWDAFADKVAIQLNDTHPAVAVPELMRQLMDLHDFGWDEAWAVCRRVFSYTNHTLMPEALERWSVPLFEKMLPRHLQIIYELNQRFLEVEVEPRWPGNDTIKAELSIIEEGNPKMIRMSYLSVVASHTVNGVAAMHTKLLRARLFAGFDALYPGKFTNVTNGITPRRWLLSSNPELSALVDEVVGGDWPRHLDALRGLEAYADDPAFQEKFAAAKRANKVKLAAIIRDRCDVVVDPDAIFDAQVKRLHEYKRQHLNLLHILTLYRRLQANPDLDIRPRVFVFGAKAAPGYTLAKTIIHAINAVGAHINNDPRIRGKLKVVFIPNYGVSLAERIIPAADVSEQISTAGKEASGTGNMKFALNGALTVGTLDGANVEILEAVGPENIFIFGMNVDEVGSLRAQGYDPWVHYRDQPELRHVLDWLASRYFTPHEPGALGLLRDSMLEGGDPYMVLADYAAYCDAQAKVDAAYAQPSRWWRMAILNTARVGWFSTDRTIGEYADKIWKLAPVAVP